MSELTVDPGDGLAIRDEQPREILGEVPPYPSWAIPFAARFGLCVPSNAVLPPALFIVGLAVGAICAGVAISATCGMSLKRASIAASVYLAIQSGISFLFQSLM